ncbi:MAG TPA: hypothetical protein DIV79_02625 [Opitutae bacterium]|nr:hypothetical protein [Opitutaceae bacterium]HCR28895.1 hypothetical protein [Opitutae bacterium]
MKEPKIGDNRANRFRRYSGMALGGGICGSILVTGVLLIALFDWDCGSGIFSHLCHQHSDRCLTFGGTALAVCARCFGIYCGIAIGCFSHLILGARNKISSPWLWIIIGVAVFANGLDSLLEALGIYGNLPGMRFALGLILGVALALFVLGRAEAVLPATRERRSNRLLSSAS